MDGDEDYNEQADTFLDEDYTFLEACMDGDYEAFQSILDDDPTEEEIDERDRCGRTGLSHACSSGFLPIVEMLADVPEVDVNLPDKEGNSPLIFAAQAGQEEIVRVLLHEYKNIRVDLVNKAGLTALMKAAIQGRTKCAKLLLFAGASPKLRDSGRKMCAEEWARFCGRHDCADAIAKFTKAKRFMLRSRFHMMRNKSCSEPDLSGQDQEPDHGIDTTSHSRPRPGWLRKKFKKILHFHNEPSHLVRDSDFGSPFEMIARCVSTPLIPGAISPSSSPPALHCNMSSECIKIPKVEVTSPPDQTLLLAIQKQTDNTADQPIRRKSDITGQCPHHDA